jgi:hypothetical protein
MLLIVLILNVVFWAGVWGWMFNVRMLLTSISDQLQYTETNTERRHRELMAALTMPSSTNVSTLTSSKETSVHARSSGQEPLKSPKIDWNSKW